MLDRLDLDTEKPSDEELARKFGFEEDYYKGSVSWWQNIKPQIWSLFDEPYSSNAAKVSHIRFQHLFYNHKSFKKFIPEVHSTFLITLPPHPSVKPKLLYFIEVEKRFMVVDM